jgi:two-component system, LytTR family, response regulator
MPSERKINVKLKAILVDDEAPANVALQELLELSCPNVIVCEVCESTAKAAEAIIRHQPDVVFLDIRMPHESGIEFLKRLKIFDFDVVMVTAYDQYALDAIKLSTIDYLLKPTDIESVVAAVEKVANRRQQKREIMHYELFLEHMHGNGGRMMLPNKNGLYEAIRIADIYFCKADAHTTNFYLTEDRHFTTGTNLGEYKSALFNQNFMQSHRSYIINMDMVDKYNARDEILVLKSGHEVPIGGDFKSPILAYLKGSLI